MSNLCDTITKDNINDTDDDNYTRLMRCASKINIKESSKNNINEALKLINLGANLEIMTLDGECNGCPENGHTALSIAIFSNSYDMVKLLLEKGANIKHKSYSEFYDNGDYKTGNLISKIETMLELGERYKNQNIIDLLK